MTPVLRDLRGLNEFRAAEALQSVVWGADDKEDPADLMMVIQQEGGLAAGAFLDGQLMGYVFGFPTITPGVQHSHRLAVHPGARGTGLGIGLKWYQRDWCLSRGINHVRWTFDPLLATNASLNIARLGGQSCTYLRDYYGTMEGINKGTPSDRLLVDWHLASPAVAARASGRMPPAMASDAVRVAIPADFAQMQRCDLAQALQVRATTGDCLIRHFDAGRVICGYDTATQEYLLSDRAGLQL